MNFFKLLFNRGRLTLFLWKCPVHIHTVAYIHIWKQPSTTTVFTLSLLEKLLNIIWYQLLKYDTNTDIHTLSFLGLLGFLGYNVQFVFNQS